MIEGGIEIGVVEAIMATGECRGEMHGAMTTTDVHQEIEICLKGEVSGAEVEQAGLEGGLREAIVMSLRCR